MVVSGKAGSCTTEVMGSIVNRLSVGTSGWSYPSWRPGFYPAGTPNDEFLRFYAERLSSVELNTTGYRLPSEEQFVRWAGQTPAGFRFAVKLPQRALRSIATFEERVRRLGERLGPVRAVIETPRDDGLLELLLGSTDLRLAFDFRHESWADADVAPAVRVDDWDAEASFRYLRFRRPPYDEQALREVAARVRTLLEEGVEIFAYFRHEDEPSAPLFAQHLRRLVLGETDPMPLHSGR
jgi:uncharacterized protein YecE (DUF72 family)